MNVKLRYFRNSGKQFGEADYFTKENRIMNIVNEVRGFKVSNTLPGTKEIDIVVLVEAEVEGEKKAHLVI